jgi:hypothetical protein
MRDAQLTFGAIVDGLMVFTIGPVLGITMCPGALLRSWPRRTCSCGSSDTPRHRNSTA